MVLWSFGIFPLFDGCGRIRSSANKRIGLSFINYALYFPGHYFCTIFVYARKVFDMKNISCFLVGLILASLGAHSQKNNSGIYLSQADFANNKLSYVGDKNTRTKIRFNEFIEKPFITVIQNGRKEHIFKDEIFAYKNKGNIIRTWSFTTYKLVSKGILWVYSREVFPSRGKGVKKEKRYFYSIPGENEILSMNINNLKRSFPNNQLFHVFLDARYGNNAGFSQFNSGDAHKGINNFLESAFTNDQYKDINQ